MTTNKFIRNYRLYITSNGKETIIQPPIRIDFDAVKSISGQLNKMSIMIHNLSVDTRLRIVKDAEDSTNIPLRLDIGYKDTMTTVFSGSVWKGSNMRQGADIVTKIECLDGGFDLYNSFTNQVVKGSEECWDVIFGGMTNVTKGKITGFNSLTRPKVLFGNNIKLVENITLPTQTWFIDNEKLYIMAFNEIIGSGSSRYIPLISAKTGLISTPERLQKKVSFRMFIDPTIRLAHWVQLESTTAPHLNGTYRIEDLNYTGSNYSDSWEMTCVGFLIPDAVVL